MPDNDPGVLARPSQEKEGSADRLWRAMNGLDETDNEKRAERFMIAWLDGYVASGALGSVKLALIDQFNSLRAPVGVTVGEPALTGLEVTDEMVERAARALVEQRGLEPDGEYQEIKHWNYELGNARAALTAALQAERSEGGSPTSPIQTSELEEAGNGMGLR